MKTDDALLARVKSEYREMPGLRLTLAEACRLWQVDEPTCQRLLTRLLDERFLFGTRDGAFVAFAPARPESIPTALNTRRLRQRHVKRHN